MFISRVALLAWILAGMDVIELERHQGEEALTDYLSYGRVCVVVWCCMVLYGAVWGLIALFRGILYCLYITLTIVQSFSGGYLFVRRRCDEMRHRNSAGSSVFVCCTVCS